MIPQPNISFTEPEIVEFELEEEPKWIKIKLKDGTVLELKNEITGVVKIGHDTNTGIPIYNVQSQAILRVKYVPKELIKKVQKQGPTGYQ
ncbi:MAG: hypothetical protein ACP5L0_07790 [Caldisphaera sp.]|jgi:hypothetical protein|uniref:hypothetical protein n=1 Tax=Caldisphaera sp. TaxID=2060322 RepID=UPI003D0A04A5